MNHVKNNPHFSLNIFSCLCDGLNSRMRKSKTSHLWIFLYPMRKSLHFSIIVFIPLRFLFEPVDFFVHSQRENLSFQYVLFMMPRERQYILVSTHFIQLFNLFTTFFFSIHFYFTFHPIYPEFFIFFPIHFSNYAKYYCCVIFSPYFISVTTVYFDNVKHLHKIATFSTDFVITAHSNR